MSELIVSTATQRKQVYQKLCGLIQAIPGVDLSIDLDELTPISALAMDSLRLVEIIFELERHFDIAADESAMAEARTLGDVVSLFTAEARED